MACSPPPGDPHTEATNESLQNHWHDDGNGWGSGNVHRKQPKPTGTSQTLHKQRRNTAMAKQRRPPLLFMALVVVAIAGGASAGWWWTLRDGRGNDKGILKTHSEAELDNDIHKVAYAGKQDDQSNQRGSVASASDVVDQQLAALGLKRRSSTGAGGPGLLRWSRFGLRGHKPQDPGVMRLGKGAGDKVQGEADGGASENEEGLDDNGIGGGGVLVESRKALFGADQHAHDAQQPAHMRVGMSGSKPGGSMGRERDEGAVADLALEQQSYFGMGMAEEQKPVGPTV